MNLGAMVRSCTCLLTRGAKYDKNDSRLYTLQKKVEVRSSPSGRGLSSSTQA